MKYMNIEEYVGLVTIDYPNEHAFTFMGDKPRVQHAGVESDRLDFAYTTDTIHDAVLTLFDTMSCQAENKYVDADHVNSETINQIIELQAANSIVTKTYRGAGNIVLEGKYVTYVGNGGSDLNDTGLVLYRNSEDKYAIVTIDMTGKTPRSLSNYAVKIV